MVPWERTKAVESMETKALQLGRVEIIESSPNGSCNHHFELEAINLGGISLSMLYHVHDK
jgi:hypothetical protein